MFVDLVGGGYLFGEVGSIAFMLAKGAYTDIYMHGRGDDEVIHVPILLSKSVKHYNELLVAMENPERIELDETYTADEDDRLLNDDETAERELRSVFVSKMGEDMGNQMFESVFTPPAGEVIEGDVGAVDDEIEEEMRE